ncbi:MAG: hypothetical protein QF918_13170 [Pirellulaceae bacterium]|nr:hypothetical protein [Pirellulaceae bacterium]MDP6555113.1 hypothetical protein [Pirellulaceae bacterium]MDP6720493.1 hypothetical protein [Pirellulaceae bacterium]
MNKERTPQESADLADTLVEQVIQIGTQPADRYVLLEKAIDIAAKAAAVDVAARALQELDNSFAVDLVQLQADAARQVARVAKEPWQHKAVVELLEGVIDECLSGERYDLATSLVDVALDAARKSKNSSCAFSSMVNRMVKRRLLGSYARQTIPFELEDLPSSRVGGFTAALTKLRFSAGLSSRTRSAKSIESVQQVGH